MQPENLGLYQQTAHQMLRTVNNWPSLTDEEQAYVINYVDFSIIESLPNIPWHYQLPHKTTQERMIESSLPASRKSQLQDFAKQTLVAS